MKPVNFDLPLFHYYTTPPYKSQFQKRQKPRTSEAFFVFIIYSSTNPKHRLGNCPLSLRLIQLLTGGIEFFHSLKFRLCVLQAEVSISIHRNPNFAMAHKVLQCFRVHAGFRHIAAIGVAADVRRYAWHLQAVNLVVPLNHIVESVFPVHCDQRHSIFVVVQKSRVPIYYMKSGLRCPFLL